MNYKVFITDNFKKEAKKLSKKYPSLKSELAALGNELSKKPDQGTSLGNNVYKIRLSISSKGKGKSGGARIITFVKITQATVYLLSIYNKGEKDDISYHEIKQILKEFL
ncbi:MAG: type II toxin-antitoxin system RelE/ParE family toxin [Bacteroidales bacterium]